MIEGRKENQGKENKKGSSRKEYLTGVYMMNETKWQENMFVLGTGDLIYGYTLDRVTSSPICFSSSTSISILAPGCYGPKISSSPVFMS